MPDDSNIIRLAERAERILAPPSLPMAVAREFVAERHTRHDGLTLHYWRGGWWQWFTSHWRELEDRQVQSTLYHFTEDASYDAGKGLVPWAPNRHKIADVVDALKAVCYLSAEIDQPSWLDGRDTNGIIVSVANGLLEVGHRSLLRHTPVFFNQTAVPFDYDANAPEPKRWLEFLKQLWLDDAAAIDVLGEWFGYVISGRLDLHKILLMVGPTRGGKGVVARILGALVGRQNVAGPTLNSLGGEFGLAPLIGKTLAVISDARFVGKNSSIVVERLLSISGEDTLTVNRKYRDQWNGKLPSRLHVISNELPRLGDASAAIVGRIVLLPLSRSWLGKEDYSLEPELLAELTGILNFALDGLHRLTVENDNAFTRLASADEAITAMRDLASPVGAFVREKCQVGAEYEVDVDILYGAYKNWCDDTGNVRHPKHVFGRDLKAAQPTIRKTRPRDESLLLDDDDDKRHHVYAGIRLTPPKP